MNATEKLIKARTQLIMDQPFFGSLALRLQMIEDRSIETAYTNGVVLGYHQEFIRGLTLEETKWLVAHEVMHLAMMHHTRRAGRQPDKWNIAADYAINGILDEAGFKKPVSCLLDFRFDGKSAEAIYDLLPDKDQENGASGPGNGPGEVRDAPGNCNGDLKKAEAQWRVNLAQAVQQAQTMGNLPAGVQRLVEEIIHPKVDWRTLLRHFVEQAARNDYSWLPPSRRYLAHGLCLPGLASKELGRVVIAVDTSGSIDTANLNQFAAEISGILEEFNMALIYIVYCDAKVQGFHIYDHYDLPLKLVPVGGGGTDFRPVFKWLEMMLTPRCLIYLTDLECTRFPDKVPDYPVLWVKTGDGGYTVPFGDVVQIT